MTRGRWTAMVAVALPLLVGCSSQGLAGAGGSAASPADAPPASSASSPAAPVGAPVTLRLADAEDQGRSSQPWIDRFIEKVTINSGGTITIEPIYNAGGGNDEKPGEVVVAGQVIAGDVELALVPVRAWSSVGVTSLQALAAPLLIDSDALLTAVASDPLTEPLLGAMREQGLVGLALWPDDLRHPFAWEQNGPPILKASDLKGATVWTLPSKLQMTILDGLGASPINATPAEVDSMVAAGSLRGAESGFNGIASLSGTPTGTADVVLYPKYQVLVAEDAAFSRLAPEQQAIVRAAATSARDLAIANHRPDAEIAKAWCEAGGRVVLAGEANVATFRDAAGPVINKLAEDPLTATAIEAIRALRARTPASTVTACEPPLDPDAPWPSVAPGPPLTFIPDGVYVHSVTRPELIAAGVAEEDATNNAGKWTLTVTGDHGSWKVEGANGTGESQLEFKALGDRVRFQQVDHPSFNDVRWRLEGDTLILEIVNSDWNTAQAQITLNAYWGGDWTKVE